MVRVQYIFTIILNNLRSTPINILENSLRWHHGTSCHSPQIFKFSPLFSATFNVIVPSFPSLQLWLYLPHTTQRGFSLHPLENMHAVSSSLPLIVCVSHISVLLGPASYRFGSQTDRFKSELCVHYRVILDLAMHHFSIL